MLKKISFIHRRTWRVFALVLCLCGSRISKAQEQLTLLPDAPKPQPGIIVGTVIDVNNDTIPGATVILEGPVLRDHRTVVSNDDGFFEFKDLEPGAAYRVTISANGFASWTSPDVTLKPSEYVILKGSKLQIAGALTTINVAAPVASAEEIATEQVKAEERQRVFGIIPNFYVVYDQNAEVSRTCFWRVGQAVAAKPSSGSASAGLTSPSWICGFPT